MWIHSFIVNAKGVSQHQYRGPHTKVKESIETCRQVQADKQTGTNAGKPFKNRCSYSGIGRHSLPSPLARWTSSPARILSSFLHPFEEPCILLQWKRKSETDLNSLAIATAISYAKPCMAQATFIQFVYLTTSAVQENSPKSGDLMETTVSVSCSGLVSLDSAVLGGRVEEWADCSMLLIILSDWIDGNR